MDYMTLKEAAEKWGVTPRRVNYYCAGGRIPGGHPCPDAKWIIHNATATQGKNNEVPSTP